jgi:hypothetical protein
MELMRRIQNKRMTLMVSVLSIGFWWTLSMHHIASAFSINAQFPCSHNDECGRWIKKKQMKKCPCGSAKRFQRAFMKELNGEPVTDQCRDDERHTVLIQNDPETEEQLPELRLVAIRGFDEFESTCRYSVVDVNGEIVKEMEGFDLFPEEVEACREDIRKLIAELDDCQRPPEIGRVESFREGGLVFFRVFYTDPNADAEGFGFRGVKGSRWAEEEFPFSSPSYGRVSHGIIEYPFNHGCGTSSEYESDVEVWIYDSAGLQSPPVTVHLACSAPSE